MVLQASPPPTFAAVFSQFLPAPFLISVVSSFQDVSHIFSSLLLEHVWHIPKIILIQESILSVKIIGVIVRSNNVVWNSNFTDRNVKPMRLYVCQLASQYLHFKLY